MHFRWLGSETNIEKNLVQEHCVPTNQCIKGNNTRGECIIDGREASRGRKAHPFFYADQRNGAGSIMHPLRVAKAEPKFGPAVLSLGCGCMHNALARKDGIFRNWGVSSFSFSAFLPG